MRQCWSFIRMRDFFPAVNCVSWWQAAFEWDSVLCSSRIFIGRKMTESFGFRGRTRTPKTCWTTQTVTPTSLWLLAVPQTQEAIERKAISFHSPYNENPTWALNTTSLKCRFPSIDAIDRQKNSLMGINVQGHLMQACFIEIQQVFTKKKVGYFSNRVVFLHEVHPE